MVDLKGAHRIDHAQFVGHRGDVRQRVGNPLAAAAVLFELGLRPHRLEFFALQLSDLLAFGEFFGHRLAVQFGKFRFVVEGFQMRGAAGHAQVDDRFGPGTKMTRVDHAGPFFGFGRRGGRPRHHGAQRQRSHPGHAPTEEGATGQTVFQFVEVHKRAHQLRVIVSCMFSSARQTAVQPACSAALPAAWGASPTDRSSLASCGLSR